MEHSNPRPGQASVSDSGRIQHENDDHIEKKIWWPTFRSGGDHWGKRTGWRKHKAQECQNLQLDGLPQAYSYNQLCVATRGFHQDWKLGQGGSGGVYRGELPSGIAVAVKRINANLRLGEGMKVFMDEVSIISRLSHRNLIELVGYCEDVAKKEYLLVYELMPNGSLDDALFGHAEGMAFLSWEQRLKALSGTADALAYLHQGWKKQVIHRDIKCSNILLDKDWNAKLGDFGIARLIDHERESGITTAVGTPGYIPPEVFQDGRFTDKTDVYGFGVVILEVACGRRVLPDKYHKMGLVDWVWQSLSKGNHALLRTVDRRLRDYDHNDMKMVLTIGLACCHPDPSERPSMKQVVQLLAGDVPVPSIPTSKPSPGMSLDPEISVTDLLGFKPGGKPVNSYRARSTYVSDSAQGFPKTSANGHSNSSNCGCSISRMEERKLPNSLNCGCSIPRMEERKPELSSRKGFEKEKTESQGLHGQAQVCSRNEFVKEKTEAQGLYGQPAQDGLHVAGSDVNRPLSLYQLGWCAEQIEMKTTECVLKFHNTNKKILERYYHEDHTIKPAVS